MVFQCRDEGPLRARVRWLRGNGLPLPPGSRDINGRLEMPDIQVCAYTLPLVRCILYACECPLSLAVLNKEMCNEQNMEYLWWKKRI